MKIVYCGCLRRAHQKKNIRAYEVGCKSRLQISAQKEAAGMIRVPKFTGIVKLMRVI